MQTITVDDDVYEWLQSQAVPLKDTPSTVLRRIKAELEARSGRSQPEVVADSSQSQTTEPTNAEALIKRWEIPVVQGYYHQGGTFYMNLTKFPGALFDPNGYVVFETEDEYRNCAGVNVGDEKTNVRKPGIRALPQYKRTTDEI